MPSIALPSSSSGALISITSGSSGSGAGVSGSPSAARAAVHHHIPPSGPPSTCPRPASSIGSGWLSRRSRVNGARGGPVADRFVAVSGNIGVGKTTLVRYLTERYGIVPVYEPFGDNPYLDDFYADMDRWAFHSQVFFLARKFRLHQDLEAAPGTFVMDRTIYEDAEIFATYLARSRKISKRDFSTYLELYEAMKQSLRPPDLMIHLRCSVRAIRSRIRQRGRPSEQDIPVTYLRRLNGLYEEWIGGWNHSPLVIWDSENADYLSDLVDRLDLHRAIERFL
ncbi:MAG: deoxynucleoside kinase [Alphaproteobacteria bacterium]|nr:deoxynucleoside kinase [Alphaproteobacteria bacterium]MCB9698930.1 deoxynucleoside kinase [Alphaproteobacteria bacterium]